MAAEPTSSQAVDFIVNRTDLRQCKVVRAADPDSIALAPGEALLRVACFAFTANNVTYAVAGDMLSYWNFFPTEAGWGKVPVWGFADVLRSNHAGVAAGERVFGYLPMSTHLVLQPDRVEPGSFVDAAPHRQALPAVYNQYQRVEHDPTYRREYEHQLMLFRPLFMSAFLLDDFIADNDFFGARRVILSSASSKTAFGLAFLLHQNRRSRCDVVGLTSQSNVGFVEGLGCYDRVVTYDQIQTLSPDVPVVLVDMAGNGTVVSTVHHHFGDNVKHSCSVGVTHWEQRQRGGDLPGAQPTFFFAPTQMQKRTHDWGPKGFQERYGASWQRFVELAKGHVRVIVGHGPAAVEAVYLETLEGQAKPDEGHVLSLWERE